MVAIMKTYATFLVAFILVCFTAVQAWSGQSRAPSRPLSSSLSSSATALPVTDEAATTRAIDGLNPGRGVKDSDTKSARWYKQQSVLLRRYTEQALSGFRPEAIRDATDLLQKWPTDGSAKNEVPSTMTYNTVLKAWKTWAESDRRRNWDSAVKACESLLQDMEARRVADVVSHTTFLSLLAVRGTKTAARRATQSLQDLSVQPNGRTLNAVLLAWTNAGCVDEAARLLQQWEDDASFGSLLSTASYAIIMAGYSKSRKGNPDDNFAAIINTWERLWQRYESTGDAKARPNLYALTILLGACQAQKTVKAAQTAESALFRLYGLPPETAAALGTEQGCVENPGKDVLAGVNTKVVATVVDCWQKSGDRAAGPKAQAILEWLVKEYRRTQRTDLQPNAYSFAAAIGAWARSRHFGKANHAYRLLEWMRQLHEEGVISEPPNAYCYTALIDACANIEKEEGERKRALNIAVSTFHLLKQEESGPLAPTNVTFRAVLTALRNLSPPSSKRTRAAQTVYAEAARRGQNCQMVQKRMAELINDCASA